MRSLRFVPLALATLAMLATSFAACGVTPGRAITLTFHAQGDASDFVTSTGWSVHLTECRLVMGPVYALAPATMIARASQLRELLLPVALAHGGHDDYAALEVRAEWLDQIVVDLLSPTPVLLGEADGSAGAADVASVLLEAPTASSELVHGHEAWAAGTATMGAMSIAFEGGLDIPQTALSDRIEGIAITEDGVVSPSPPQLDDAGDLLVTVHVRGQSGALLSPSWFDQAHFDRLAAPSSGTVRTIDPTTQVHQAWLLAARDADAFTAHYTAAAGR